MIVHSKPSINQSDIDKVVEVLANCHLEDGQYVRELEQEFCSLFNIKYAIAVSSGFAAILLSLMAFGIGPGDEVIIPSYACQALLNPIRILRATPIIVDVSKNSFNLDVEKTGRCVSSHTKAIIVPHIFGFPAEIQRLKMLGIPIIEDCAQSLGGSVNGMKLGSFGDISVFSFYATKMICGGDGGMIITNNHIIYKKICDSRYYGHKKGHKEIAFNFHLTNMPAALALSQLRRLDEFVLKRRIIAQYYKKAFSGVNGISINFQGSEESCFYRFPIRVSDADSFIIAMRSNGVQCGHGVLDGMHDLMGLDNELYPNTAYNLKTIVSLPIYPQLSLHDADNIIASVLLVLQK